MPVVIDFDGTLSVDDTVDQLLGAYALDGWEAIETEWVEGRISSKTCMSEQIRLVRATTEELGSFFSAIQTDPGFADLWAAIADKKRIAIVSDGLDHAINTAIQNKPYSSITVYSNHLVQLGKTEWALEFPFSATDCKTGSGVCKCAIARRMQLHPKDPIILVGDGKSDACLATQADIVFAKGSLIKFCKDNHIECIEFDQFADVLKLLTDRSLLAQFNTTDAAKA